MTPTIDPNTFIEETGVHPDNTPFVIYQNNAGERWRIDGQCNMCGECLVGATDAELQWIGTVGEPNAFIDLRPEPRLDNPVRPGISELPHCTLRGEYL